MTEMKKEKSNFEVKQIIKAAKKNPWMIIAVVLGVILAINLFAPFGTISSDKAGKELVSFLNSKVGGGVELVSVEKDGSLYLVTVNYQGQDIPVYTTATGDYFIQGAEKIESVDDAVVSAQEPTQTSVPKSAKPIVELFVMSYCPYGTQAEKGILPVVALLGDKIDFKLRMVHYVLHGDKETLENNRELCIREEQGQDVLNKYLVCILDSDDPYNPKDPTACEKTAGVNSAKLQTCLKNDAEDYFAADSALSEGYGVRGSPTLIINGVESSAGRSPASYLQGICAAFENAPAECSETVSSSNPSAGFGYNEGTDTVAQC